MKRPVQFDATYLIFKQFPRNTNYQEVESKIYTLNRCYTLQFERLGITLKNGGFDHIINKILKCKDFDKWIETGDSRIIEFLREYDNGNNSKDLFSFATKYAAISSWAIGKDGFMMYDSINAKILKAHKKDYSSYVRKVQSANIENMLYADFDSYLQNMGR